MTNVIENNIKGRIHSVQSLGTVDGPGVRFVVFFQGCNLRCGCCHNPDTWDFGGGSVCTARELVDRALRCREYFGKEGGITVSGGEPLLQADFAREIFRLCREEGINTCLDTSGSLLGEAVESLLDFTDRVLLDVKYTDGESYRRYVGCELARVLDFLDLLDKKAIPTTLRQVIIPTLNDSEENIRRLNEIAAAHPCVDGAELLPFKKICRVKYDSMGLDFPFADLPTPDKKTMDGLNAALAVHKK